MTKFLVALLFVSQPLWASSALSPEPEKIVLSKTVLKASFAHLIAKTRPIYYPDDMVKDIELDGKHYTLSVGFHTELPSREISDVGPTFGVFLDSILYGGFPLYKNIEGPFSKKGYSYRMGGVYSPDKPYSPFELTYYQYDALSMGPVSSDDEEDKPRQPQPITHLELHLTQKD